MNRTTLVFVLAVLHPLLTPTAGFAGDPEHVHDHGDASWSARPDLHAPIGVMGDHMHPAGGFMASYRYMNMKMDTNRDDTNSLTPQEVFDRGFMATPLDMTMEMHMFGFMYAPTDWLTLMAMLPYVRQSMDHVTRMNQPFTTKSDGLGDVSVGSLWRLWEDEMHHVHLNFGLSIPTGKIARKDDTPQGNLTLPFPMQIGSGTPDLLPGMTYTGHSDAFSWGSQLMGRVRLGKNYRDWAGSNRVDFTAWTAYPWTKWLSTSVRFGVHWWSNYRGDESAPPSPTMIPTADPNRRGGTNIDILGGLNFAVPLGKFLGEHRFAIEGGAPVYQNLKGPQLEQNYTITVGWQKAF